MRPYLAVCGDFSSLLRDYGFTRTADGYRVFGATIDPEDPVTCFPPLGGDATILPVDYHNGVARLARGDVPVGHSCDLALSMLYVVSPLMTLPEFYTGTVTSGLVGPVLGIADKALLAFTSGTPLIGAVPDVTVAGRPVTINARTVDAAVGLWRNSLATVIATKLNRHIAQEDVGPHRLV